MYISNTSFTIALAYYVKFSYFALASLYYAASQEEALNAPLNSDGRGSVASKIRV